SRFAPVARLRQSRSAVPSLLVSPTPLRNQLRLATGARLAVPRMAVPFIRQIRFAPVRLLRQTRSLLPSPFMSPTPASIQSAWRTVGSTTLVAPPRPFISHTSVPIVLGLYQTISVW